MNKLKLEYQSKDDSKSTTQGNNQSNVCVEKQLPKIYKQKDNLMWCISCQQDIMQQNIYIHIFDPLHILLLQEYFIEKKYQHDNRRDKLVNTVDIYNQISQPHKIKKESINKEDKKLQTYEFLSINNNLDQNRNIENYIDNLQYDLKAIGKISLSLIVSILVKTYCTITEVLDMKFSQILDKSTFYYLKINNSWEKSYLILKQRFPDYLQELINKNAGSSKPLIKLLGQNKRQNLSKELWLGCQTISNLTNDADYISFLQGLTLKKLKKMTIERTIKKNIVKNQNLQTQEEKPQDSQDKIQFSELQKFEQIKHQEKKQVIKIVIKQKQKQILNEKQETTE